MPITKRDTRARKSENGARLRDDLAAARQLAQDADRVMAARAVFRASATRLRELRRAHAVLVDVVANTAGVKIGMPGAVPGGLEVPGHRELVRAMRALPWIDHDGHVRGAVDDDRIETIRVLLALETGLTHSAACRLAAAAGRFPDKDAAIEVLASSGKSRHPETERLRKLTDPDSRTDYDGPAGALERWKADIRNRAQLFKARLVGPHVGQSADDYERMRARVLDLARRHRL